MTYKITKKPVQKGKQRQSQAANTSKLALSVEYRCTDEDVLDRLRRMFAFAVENSTIKWLSRLLIDVFAERVQHHILPFQFEKIVLLERVDLGRFDDMGWSDCLESLPPAARDGVRDWLLDWHQVSCVHTLMLEG